MREIKFRAWNTVTSKMIKNLKEMGTFALLPTHSCEEFLVIPTNEKYPLMQYTGLKDINCVEIYEGDIVRWGLGFTGAWDEESWHRYAKVELFPSLQFRIIYYIEGKTGNKKPSDDYVFEYGRFAYQDTEKYLQVIGNIYENPELLNEEKEV